MGAFLQEVTSINPEVEKRIGHNIRQLREKAGLTQEWVAAQLQLSGCDITPVSYTHLDVYKRQM